MNAAPHAFFWFRRDLRLEDNAGLHHALKSGLPVVPVFLFDTEILGKLEDRTDKRVGFIYQRLKMLKADLNRMGSDLLVSYGTPEEAWNQWFSAYNIKAIFTNRDYEPYAKTRDSRIKELAAARGCSFHDFKDQCIFEGREIRKANGTPYTVFTPYSKMWKQALHDGKGAMPYQNGELFPAFFRTNQPQTLITADKIGFEVSESGYLTPEINGATVDAYKDNRDFPAREGTSRLGVHLRFGTLGIRKLVQETKQRSETFLNELIWREFYMMILDNFPQVGTGSCFKPVYEHITWRNNEEEFERWCKGETGYPIVDAGMRELNATGFMHNRVRMITASFLTKHLLIDWRWGEAYFASRLLDFDLSANNGGWQWAAGCGTDAAPYFRVFNPSLQTARFDPQFAYIRKWVQEFQTNAYPKPIVNHDVARKRCLEVYRTALAK